MEEFLKSPFGEDLSGWALPSGEEPHGDTIGLLRGFAGSGNATRQEVFHLAEFLNDNREARHAWPGEPLFAHLCEIFSSGELAESELARLGRIVAEIERQSFRAAAPPPAEAEIPEAAVRIEDLKLPRIDLIQQVAAEGSRGSYDVDLARQICSCPGWFGNRRGFKDYDLRLCCVHIATAFTEAFARGMAEESSSRLLIELMRERTRRGRGIDPKSEWKVLKIRMRPHLVSYGSGEWSSVYVFNRQMELDRYAYHRTESRWSFGRAPINHRVLSEFLAKKRQKNVAFT